MKRSLPTLNDRRPLFIAPVSHLEEHPVIERIVPIE